MSAMKKNQLIILSLVACLALAAVSLASGAVANAIDWHVFSGGGASASAGDVSLTTTLGQTAIGSSTSGNVNLVAGFWHGVVVPEVGNDIYLPLVLK
jgi:hypothetical protein